MSLTSFIKIPRIRGIFSTSIPKPKLKIESDILAPPLTKNYTIVGIAFDYLLHRRGTEFLCFRDRKIRH